MKFIYIFFFCVCVRGGVLGEGVGARVNGFLY